MIRTTCDEVVLRRRQRALGIAAALGCLLLAVPALPNSQSAAVVQVRVGKHPTFTRVVFELDGEADYAVRQARDSKEILVELDAGSRRRVMTSRSDLVETVSVQPADGGSLARIRVSQIPVHITEMLLSNPTRIVLDLRSEPEQLAATKPSPTPAPGDPETDGREEPAGGVPDVTPEPAPERKPEPEPEPEPAVVAGGPDVSAGTGGVGGAEDEPPAGQDDPVPSDPTGGEPDLDPWATLDPDLDPVTGDPGIDEPGTSDPEPGLAVTEPGGAAATGDDPLAAGGDLDDPTTPGSAGELPLFSSLPEAVRDPRALVGLGGALVVGVLLAAWSRSRRRDRRGGLFSKPGAPLRDLEPVVEASPEPFEDRTLPRVTPEEPGLGADASLFDTAVGMEEPAAEEDEKPEIDQAGAGGVTPPVVAPPAVAPSSPELEQRISGLERRLEEVLDAKDRLERHVAAQTEELRVQRAAIARTQRVLRNLTRPDDAPTEPALKVQQD